MEYVVVGRKDGDANGLESVATNNARREKDDDAITHEPET